MGKGRRPCCDKAGVKKGPWSQAEDYKLMSFIQKHGHNNWRALPKLAGLARCGKSCRLRWVNYLRPDLKRGNFSLQEEEAIIKLHEVLGNRWSKIASHFPGRTDNEIKNVWNTHLKKRLKDKGSNGNSTVCNAPSTSKYNKSDKLHCNEVQVLTHQTITNNDNIEYSSSSSTSYNSISNLQMIENVGDPKDEASACIDNSSENSLLEIPFEPNLDLWDLLHDVPFKEVDAPIFENDTKNYNINQTGESWWWLVYLENELGLDHLNQSAPQQYTDDNDFFTDLNFHLNSPH